MKTIFRTLLILLVAAIVGVIIFALVGNSNTAGPRVEFERRGSSEFHPEGSQEGNVNPQFERQRERSGGIIGLPFSMLGNLAVIALIAVIYLNVCRWFKRKSVVTTK